jgi:hypothetical protein
MTKQQWTGYLAYMHWIRLYNVARALRWEGLISLEWQHRLLEHSADRACLHACALVYALCFPEKIKELRSGFIPLCLRGFCEPPETTGQGRFKLPRFTRLCGPHYLSVAEHAVQTHFLRKFVNFSAYNLTVELGILQQPNLFFIATRNVLNLPCSQNIEFFTCLSQFCHMNLIFLCIFRVQNNCNPDLGQYFHLL